MFEDTLMDFNFALMEGRDVEPVLALIEDVIGYRVEFDDFTFGQDSAIGSLYETKTGFRQVFFFGCRKRPEWAQDIEEELAWRLATELQDYVMIDNLGDQFKWTLFTPDGNQAVAEIYDTEDSFDLVEPDDTAYWLIYWAIKPWINASENDELMEAHFLIFDFSEESVREAVRRDLIPHFLSLSEENQREILDEIPKLDLEDSFIVKTWDDFCTPFYIDDDPQGFLNWLIDELAIAAKA